MYTYLKALWSRGCASFLVVIALAASMLTVQAGPAFAAACTGAPLDASSAPAECEVHVAASISPGALTMATDANAILTGPAGNTGTPFTLKGTAIPVTFTFTSLVKDHRGLKAGWALTAHTLVANGLVGQTGNAAGTNFPLSLTGLNAVSSCKNDVTATTPVTCPSNPSTNAIYAPGTGTPLVLSTTDTPLVTAGDGTTVLDGDYTNVINGAFTIPVGAPSGTYAADIAVTLTNAF